MYHKKKQPKKLVPKAIVKPASENGIAFWSAVSRKRARDCGVYEDFSFYQRQRVFQQFQRRCFRCGSGYKCQIDHHTPLSFGYPLEYGNAVCLCQHCNHAKSNLWPTQFYTEAELTALAPMLEEQRTWKIS